MAITLVIVWIIGPGFNMAYMTPSAKITDDGDCTVYSEWPDKTTQKAVGVFTVFLQFIMPLLMLAYGYTRMALVLHRRVETSEPAAAGALVLVVSWSSFHVNVSVNVNQEFLAWLKQPKRQNWR